MAVHSITCGDIAVKNSDTELLSGIQLLRGLSVLLVLATHADLMVAYPRYVGSSPLGLVDTGLFGVSIFFVISGFIIAKVALSPDGSARHPRGEFARRRLIRIVPFLWVAVIGYNLLSALGTGVVEWEAALRAMVVWPVGEMKPNVIWSLRHEFLFYGLFALCLLGRRRWMAPLVAWFVAPIVAWPILTITHSTIPDDPGPWAELFRVVLLGARGGANLQFGGGFLLGWLTIRGSAMMARRDLHLGWAAAAALAVAVVAERLALPIGLQRTIVWSLLAVPPVWLAIISGARPSWLATIGNTLGDASFAIYLVHNAALLIAFEVARRVHLQTPAVVLILACLAAIAAGLIAHRFVERPLIAALGQGRRLVPWRFWRRRG